MMLIFKRCSLSRHADGNGAAGKWCLSKNCCLGDIVYQGMQTKMLQKAGGACQRIAILETWSTKVHR
eukprot:13150741-Ditylum_brightwellii.AAC.1